MNKFTVLAWNACWLTKKRQVELRYRLLQNKIDIACISETKVKEVIAGLNGYL